MRRWIGVVVLAALLAGPGCGTIAQAIRGGAGPGQGRGPAVFGGTRSIAHSCADLAAGRDWELLPVICMVLDGPLSLAADLLLLPYAAVNELIHGGFEVPTFLDMWSDRLHDWRRSHR